jgi:archaellum component FlaF (FlaF/FlaG flagellin family)
MTAKHALTTCALLLFAAAAMAQVPPEGDPVAPRTYAAPEVSIPNAHQPLTKLPAELASRLQQQITALGISGAYAAYDLRAGHWGTLSPTKPLVPGTGVGNSLTWAALGRTAPTTDAAYKQAAWQAIKSWLDVNRVILGIDSAQLDVPVISSYEGRRLLHVSANRVVNGIPVRTSFVQATLNNGNLVLYGAYNWGSIDVATTPTVSKEQAKRTVTSHLSGFSITDLDGDPELVILPVANGDAAPTNEGRGYRYRLAWEVHPRVGGSSGSWEALVDAQSGQLLAFHDRNHYFDKKKVVGGIFPVSNDGQSPEGIPDGVEQSGYPMSHAYVFDSQGNRLEANSEGLVSVEGAYAMELTGPFLRINDGCGSIDEASICPALDLGASGGTDCTVPGGHSAGDTHSARTGFYEVNRVIDQAKSWLGPEANAATPAGWLNRQLPANMNLNNTCNAFFSPLDTSNATTGSINFYRQGPHPTSPTTVCRNTGEIAAVFDHEWGHGLDTYDNAPGVSLPGEAYADMTAIHRLNTSCVGRGFYLDNPIGGFCGGNGDPCTECTGVREADWKKRQSGKPHDISWVLGQSPTIPGSCPISPVSTSPISPTPFNSGPCFRNTHCEGSIITEAIWDLLKRDLPCQGVRWESYPGGAVYGGRCTAGTAATIDEGSALVLGTRLFYLASNGISMGYQCGAAPGGSGGDPSIGGCTAGSWYLNYLVADDDDGSLANGTPHMVAINDAFVRHGLACPPQAPPAGVMNFGCVATPPPANKAAVTATAGLRSATVTWTEVAGAGEYWVLRTDGVQGCNFGKTRVAQISATSPRTYTETDLLEGLTYYYSVVAVGGAAGVGVDACPGAMSDCAAVTPFSPDSTIPTGMLVEQATGAPAIESGDGDQFVDNCEVASLTMNVINIGAPLTGVKVTAIQPSNSGTQVLTSLPINLPNLPYGCGSRAATTPVTFRFRLGGAAPQSSMTFTVTATANELSAPVTGTLTLNDLETDLGSGNITWDFENGTQEWEVVAGTFSQTNLPPPAAEGTSFYMKSSTAIDNACDRVRSPKVRLTPASTLSLFNQFVTEAETPGTPFYDRANVGIIDATGERTIASPDGGRPYNALNSYTGCNNGPGWATDIPDAPDNRFAQSSWSSGALNAANLVGQEVQVEVTYGSDSSASLDGFQFDQVRLTNVLLKVPDAQSNVCATADLQVTNVVASNAKPKEGDRVTVTATISNVGSLGSAASKTEFLLDGTSVLGLVDTAGIAAGGSATVSIPWNTQGVKGDHVIRVTADKTGLVSESNENNNVGNFTVTVQGNKVKNGSFEQSSSSGSGPEGWSGSSTGAGNASWSEGGSEGSKSAATSGNGGNAGASGPPSWTSDPIAVTPGEVLAFAVSIQSQGASSAASAGLVYLGAAGNVLSTVNLITAPLTTTGFAKLQQAVTIPAGVAQVRVKLIGFSPTDLRTSGTVKFDEVGLFGN